MNEFVEHENLEQLVREKLTQMGLQFRFDDINYRLEKMFPKTKGWGAKGEIKKKVKLIQAVEPVLPQALHNEEEVLYVAKGIQHSMLEAASIGALWSNMINQTVFVLTNLRLIMFHSDTSGNPKETCWQIYYSEIKNFKKTLMSNVMKLHLSDGRKLQFAGFTGLDRKAMPEIFDEALSTFNELGFRPECSQSREDLCGRCYQIVPKNTYRCDSCGTEFWKPSEIALRSLIIPSWGDFLIGHNLFAIVETIGFVLSWMAALALFFKGEFFSAILLILFAHAFDAAVTYFIARKGLHPKGKRARI